MPRYIDADKLIPIYEEMIRSGDYCKDCMKDAIFEIEQAPTISPDEVRGVGEWLDHPIDDDWKICSVCGVGSRFRYTLFDGETRVPFSVTEPSRYCKNCGAKMDRRSNDAEVH